MQTIRRRMALVYDARLPGQSLLERLVSFDVRLVSAQTLKHDADSLDWRQYDAILVYSAANLPRARTLCNAVRLQTAAPLLLISTTQPAEEAFAMLHDGVDVLLPLEADAALVAGHIDALLRQPRPQHGRSIAIPAPAAQAATDRYHDGCLSVDFGQRSVSVDGQTVHLTPTEYRLLALLIRYAGQPLTYDQILSSVWGWDATEHRVVHTFAAQLRTKLGQRAARCLVNEYGIGYRFAPPSD